MLILTRRPGERVVIGEDVLVTVMEVSGQTVRLGIAAPQGLPIYREEIWLAVKEENRAAAQAAPEALPDGSGETGSDALAREAAPPSREATPPSGEAATASSARPAEGAQRPS